MFATNRPLNLNALPCQPVRTSIDAVHACLNASASGHSSFPVWSSVCPSSLSIFKSASSFPLSLQADLRLSKHTGSLRAGRRRSGERQQRVVILRGEETERRARIERHPRL